MDRKSAKQSTVLAVGLVLLFCFATPHSVFGDSDIEAEYSSAQKELNNGNYKQAIEIVEAALRNTKTENRSALILAGLDIIASSQIASENYESANLTLTRALTLAQNQNDKAKVYLRFAWLTRAQRKFSEAIAFSKKALAEVPQNRQVQAEHYLNIGRVLFASGYDISAIIWFEKAEKLLTTTVVDTTKLDVLRFLALAWSSRMDYQTSLSYSEKLIDASKNTQFKYRHRQALFEMATVLSASGQVRKATLTLEKGLKVAIDQGSQYQACNFLTSLLLHSLDDGDLVSAEGYLNHLEKLDTSKTFTFEVLLGKAIIHAFRGNRSESEKLFGELDKMGSTSDFVVLYWKIEVAERNSEWSKVINLNRDLLDRTLKDNFREGLPAIYLGLAKAHFHLGQNQTATEFLDKSLSYIEEIRKSGNARLSLGILNTFHDANRLKTQLILEEGNRPQESFELADFIKARLLRDKINGTAFAPMPTISSEARRKLEETSLRYVDDPSVTAEIENAEKLETGKVPDLSVVVPKLNSLSTIRELNDTAIVSYFFTLDQRLLATVWENDVAVRSVYLPVTESEVRLESENVRRKIKTRIFFKKDGQDLFNKLLKPLAITAKHLIIIPDKDIWKIPFQALSPDGENYLIEDTVISYAPSISVLLDSLRLPKPDRRSLQAFANSSFNNLNLRFANTEASSIAALYGSSAKLNATASDLRKNAADADIFHFSMHAQLDDEQPLDSFLGFRPYGTHNGRVTVDDLLQMKFKKGSLVFLASCDTNSVLNGEGLVSLTWGAMAAGATTVISAQWEANDESTGVFTKSFYRYYKQGFSSAEALQRASLEMIKNKSNNMHEPYYWADFTLNGDFR